MRSEVSPLQLTLRRRSVASSCASRQPPSAHSMGSCARRLSNSQASSNASPIHACPPVCTTMSIPALLPPALAGCKRDMTIRSRRTRQSDGSPGGRRSGRSSLIATTCKRGSKHALGVRNLVSAAGVRRRGERKGVCVGGGETVLWP